MPVGTQFICHGKNTCNHCPFLNSKISEAVIFRKSTFDLMKYNKSEDVSLLKEMDAFPNSILYNGFSFLVNLIALFSKLDFTHKAKNR